MNGTAGSEADNAGVIARPPLLYTGALALGLLAEAARPLPLAPRGATTSIDPGTPTTALVVDGPYRYSRNPIYLALSALYLGAALLRDALWPALLFPLLLVVTRRGVAEREERYLARRFGEEYLAFQTRVRRWF